MNKKALSIPVYLKGEIRENKSLGSLYHRLRISLPRPIGPIIPGQFAMLSIEKNKDILLPRPFSIHNFDNDNDGSWLDFLFKIVGKGTALFAHLTVGSPIMILAPLGKGFPDPPSGHKPLIIAGGMGIAPLLPLVSRLKASPSPVAVFYGAKSLKDLVCLPELLDMDNITIKITTEDGTRGEKGLVTQLLRQEETNSKAKIIIYACGPEPMLKAVTDFASERKVPCWVSIERRMACGVGACLSCVVTTTDGYRRVCSDGPTFDAKDIVWRKDDVAP
jgi:dihydroorotate dehydrogenase electron transfer subunit